MELGPYPAAAARAWLANARELLDFAAASRDQLPFHLPPEVIEELRWYIDTWDTAARKDDEFRWSGEIDPGQWRTLLTYWLNLARASNELADLPTSPEPAQVFYPAVVGEILDTLGDAPEHHGFCRRMRTAWPGLDDECNR